MKTLVVMLAACAAIPVLADQKLAEKKNCLACHSVASKVVGPALKDVAAKYAGQPDAATKLAGKIQKGSSGVWGEICQLGARTGMSFALCFNSDNCATSRSFRPWSN